MIGHLVTVFNVKFFYGEAQFFLTELGRTRRFPGEDLDLYFKRFHKNTLDCCHAVDEETMVDRLLTRIVNEHLVFIESLSLPSFSNLMETAKRMNDSVRMPRNQAR